MLMVMGFGCHLVCGMNGPAAAPDGTDPDARVQEPDKERKATVEVQGKSAQPFLGGSPPVEWTPTEPTFMWRGRDWTTCIKWTMLVVFISSLSCSIYCAYWRLFVYKEPTNLL